MTDTWTNNPDGSTLFNGSVLFPAGFNSASGFGIVIFGPNGGVASFPAAVQGPAGLSPTFTCSYVEVAVGDALPGTNPAVAFTAGSGDTPDNYALTFYGHAGATGADGSSVILTATDLEGTAQAGYMIGYSAADSLAQWQPIPQANWYFSGSISATSSNTSPQKQITSILVPAQPSAWWPEVKAQATVVGAVDTQVDLVARVNTTGGEICAYGYGAPGASPPPVAVDPYGLAVGTSNIVAANTAATIYLMAENQTSSSNPWNTTTRSFMQVRPNPVP